jgi:simple sugar transport system permease protein
VEDIVISVLQRTLIAGTPLLLATIGEIICERSGILNLGVEGMLAIGAVTAFIVTLTTGNPWFGLVAAIMASALISAIHAFVSITLQSSQVVSGLALTMLGLGISGLVGKPYIGKPLAEKMATWPIPVLSDIPVVGVIFFDHSPFFYMAIILALIAWFVLKYTRLGIIIRSAGENPRATETQGISVYKIRYWCVMTGGALSGMAGAHLSTSYSKSWIEGIPICWPRCPISAPCWFFSSAPCLTAASSVPRLCSRNRIGVENANEYAPSVLHGRLNLATRKF